MLYHGVPDQCPYHVIFRWQKTRSARLIAIDCHVRLSLERVDVVNGVLLACSNINASSVVGRETGLLGSTFSGVLDCGEDLGLCFCEVDEDGLGDIVEASRG